MSSPPIHRLEQARSLTTSKLRTCLDDINLASIVYCLRRMRHPGFICNNFRAGTDETVDPRLRSWITSLVDASDSIVLQTYIRLDDPPSAWLARSTAVFVNSALARFPDVWTAGSGQDPMYTPRTRNCCSDPCLIRPLLSSKCFRTAQKCLALQTPVTPKNTFTHVRSRHSSTAAFDAYRTDHCPDAALLLTRRCATCRLILEEGLLPGSW